MKQTVSFQQLRVDKRVFAPDFSKLFILYINRSGSDWEFDLFDLD